MFPQMYLLLFINRFNSLVDCNEIKQQTVDFWFQKWIIVTLNVLVSK